MRAINSSGSKALTVGVLVIMLLVSIFAELAQGVAGETEVRAGENTLASRSPIYINGNSQFTSANGVKSGSGTKENPYIIEGWEINASNANGIEIRNTNVYFTIRNCVIYGRKTNYNYGIYFYNVANGKIESVSSYNNSCGVRLYYSSSTTITASQIYNNFGYCGYGIYLYSSSNNTISACQIYNNFGCYYGYGIYLYSSSNNTISACKIYNNYCGVYLSSSWNNTITASEIYNNSRYWGGYGVYLYSSWNNTISASKIYNNSGYWDGYGVYLYSSRNNIITTSQIYNNYCGVYLYSSRNNVITASQIYNNSYGVYLYSSWNNTISASKIYNNSGYWGGYGVYLYYYSNSNTISACRIYKNYYGIGIRVCVDNFIKNCYIGKNYYGIRIWGNTGCGDPIFHNNFINNTIQAYDASTTTVWDDGYPSGGNYWSDYTGVDFYSGPDQNQPGGDGIGDTPYNILGGNRRDRYPLMWPINMSDGVTNKPPIALFTYYPTSPTTLDTVWFTDTSHDPDGEIICWLWMFGDGTLSHFRNPTHTYANKGTYYVTLTVWDDCGAQGSATIGIVIKNIPPVAEFTYSPSSPTDLDTIQLTDLSVDYDGQIIARHWNFGDGTTSTLQNPTHQYADDGTYTVTLTVTDNDGATATISKVIVVANVQPTVDFTYSPENPTVFDVVQFTDLSVDYDGQIIAWHWDFGDGTNSTLQNPTHRYADDGCYQVTLTVWDDDGASNAITKEITITNMPPVANFTYHQGIDVMDGDDITITLRVAGRKWQSVNMSVYEDDELVGFVNITREPGSPDEQAKSISIRINASKEYDIVLSYLSNGHGANPVKVIIEYKDLTRTIHLVFNAPPGEELEETLDLDELLDAWLRSEGIVRFDASSSYDPDGEIISWAWDFGDGATGEGIVVYHKYNNGTYVVTLTVTDDDNNSSSASATITVVTSELENEERMILSPNLPQENLSAIVPSFGLLALLSLLCIVMLIERKAKFFVVCTSIFSPIFAIHHNLRNKN
ncbi:MAG: PKD domain-containing protein [Candidatus Thermoplasmatota archaeon]